MRVLAKKKHGLISTHGHARTHTHTHTANYPASVVERLPPQLESGVYYGWAQVGAEPVYPMVMSIGWNPQYQNKERSMVSVTV